MPVSHDFIIALPVADRPRMLENCIQSLATHLEQHPFGTTPFEHVSLLVVDDSADRGNARQHRELTARMNSMGLNAEYFGLTEQGRLVEDLAPGSPNALTRIIGTYNPGPLPPHKGASVCRNLAMLHLARHLPERRDPGRVLVWFVDSDEEFTSREDDGTGPGIPFFHEIDRLFKERPVDIVTGKVFGDPPVAPAVMVGGLLEDIDAFLRTCFGVGSAQPCVFHGDRPVSAHDAAYNDLRSLFGFSGDAGPSPFCCPLEGPHTMADALRSFASMLPAFFHGCHPTRRVAAVSEISETVKPARTVYTGNYVMRPQAFEFFIPFAPLRLRMAGPVLGRLVRAQQPDRFISAPLPLFHRRVLPGQNVSEFRGGVIGSELGQNLSAEFEAQFWGDVMLFTIESLVRDGYPESAISRQNILDTFGRTVDTLFNHYEENRRNIRKRVRGVLDLLKRDTAKTTVDPGYADLLGVIENAVRAVERGFSDNTSRLSRAASSNTRINEMATYVEAYPDDVKSWQALLKN